MASLSRLSMGLRIFSNDPMKPVLTDSCHDMIIVRLQKQSYIRETRMIIEKGMRV